MKNSLSLLAIVALLVGLIACEPGTTSNTKGPSGKKLPILGQKEIVGNDTTFHTIPDFSFINQENRTVTNETFKDQIYVVDFFFTSCPTICPKVKRQVMRLYDKFEDEPRLKFLSHSIDVKYDTPEALNKFGKKMGITADRWHLVTGDEDHIFDMADDYFIAAHHDEDAPGGFDHSGRIILVDKDRMVRGFAEGTEEDSVTDFMDDIQNLLDEM